ncbi:MAG: hypothetical protein KKH94_11470 [Candidatus Omnitrophica bacterium]|nr:hypothetical protein [Candidatus Omnitrophota bacterium]
MKIPNECIEEYQALVLKKRGERISRRQAYEQASSLLTLVETVFKPKREKVNGTSNN